MTYHKRDGCIEIKYPTANTTMAYRINGGEWITITDTIFRISMFRHLMASGSSVEKIVEVIDNINQLEKQINNMNNNKYNTVTAGPYSGETYNGEANLPTQNTDSETIQWQIKNLDNAIETLCVKIKELEDALGPVLDDREQVLEDKTCCSKEPPVVTPLGRDINRASIQIGNLGYKLQRIINNIKL